MSQREMPSRPWLAALLLTVGLVAQAAEPAPSPVAPERAYFDEIPVVLSGSRLPQRLDASPVAITIIDREMIEASGAREIEDLLRLAPGMVVGHHDGSTAFVTYHAFADRFARRMQVLVDGRSVYSPAFGGVDWSKLALTVDDIERIEVVRGPNAAAYGSNAFLGTISITTRRASADAHSEVQARVGERGVRDLRLTAEHVDGPLSVRLTAAQSSDQGLVSTNLWLDDERTDLLNARFDLALADGAELRFETGFSSGWRADGRPNRKRDPPHDRFVSSEYYDLSWSDAVSADSEWTVRLYDAREGVDDNYTTLPIPAFGNLTVPLDFSAQSHRTDLEVQHVQRIDERLRTVYGAAVRIDEADSRAWLGADPSRANMLYRAFAHAEWQAADDWLLNAGFMYEDTDVTESSFSPRLTATYSIVPGHSLRFGLSTATRTPVLIERYADQSYHIIGPISDQVLLSTNHLEPETIRSTELAYLGSYAAGRLLVDVRAFRDTIDQLITYYYTPYPDGVDNLVEDFRNNDAADIAGIEANIDWRPTEDWRLVGSYSYTEVEATDRDEFYSGAAPTQIASLLVIKRFANLEASVGAYYLGAYDGMDTLDAVSAHLRTDLRLALPIGPERFATRLELVVQALDGAYNDSRNDTLFKPRTTLELTSRF